MVLKEKLFCGQYACRIIGDDKLIKQIPDNWGKYNGALYCTSQTVTIRLEVEKTESEDLPTSGWCFLKRKGFSLAVHTHNGKMVFGLQYVDPHVVTVYVRKVLESNLRIGIHYGLMLALYQECIGLHGVTILCGNEIVILSAPSGTGKTTLAKLLETYCDVIMINGDFALLSPMKDGVFFEPTPFCGTSGRCLNHRFRVNRVVFLKQAKENAWYELDGREGMMHFMNNSFIPTWDNKKQQTVQDNALKCISAMKMNAFAFAPTQEAAEMFYTAIGSKKES